MRIIIVEVELKEILSLVQELQNKEPGVDVETITKDLTRAFEALRKGP